MTREHLDAVERDPAGPAGPEKGPPVDPNTGRVTQGKQPSKQGGFSTVGIMTGLALGVAVGLGVVARTGSAEDAAIATHDVVNPAAETTKAVVRGADIGEGLKSDAYNATVGTLEEMERNALLMGLTGPLGAGRDMSLRIWTGRGLVERF